MVLACTTVPAGHLVALPPALVSATVPVGFSPYIPNFQAITLEIVLIVAAVGAT